MNHDCTTWAKRIDALRIIPRALVIGGYIGYANFAVWVTKWVMAYPFDKLESEAVALAIVAFPTGILGVLAGVLASITNNYFKTGGQINGHG